MAWFFATKLYPRSTENRLWRADAALKKTRNQFLKASGKNFLYLQILFLALFCWILGSLYLQETHTHNLHIVFVDYDTQNGSIGAAIRNAYSRLQSSRFPTLVEKEPADYPEPADLRHAVCRIRYWSALYVFPGASARLEQALAGNASSTEYDPSNVMSYVWNEARYPQIVDAAISSNMQTLSQTARLAFSSPNGTGRITSLTTPSAISAFANPWTLGSINIQPTTQGSRAVYNSLVIILIMVQEFFYLGVINALYLNFKLYNRASPYRIILIRGANSLLYTFIGSLVGAGAAWAFKAGWKVDHGQWVLTWMVLWLFAHINFMAMDNFSIWVPVQFVPMFFISWLMLNVTSILIPFELSPGWFRIGYAFPAHQAYQSLTDIWSRGCNPQLYIALPVLFAWEVVGIFFSALGVFKRCHYATLAQEEQERTLREQVQAAVALAQARTSERGASRRRRVSAATAPQRAAGASEAAIEKLPTAASDEEADVERASSTGDEEEGDAGDALSEVMSRADEKMRRQQSRASRAEYGPAFGMPFDNNDSD